MFRKWIWLVLASIGLALCGAVFFQYLYPTHRVQQDSAEPNGLMVNDSEPITPIPIDLKLDTRKVALGKRLFHDPQLSSDNTISCAHCHNLINGGMDSLSLSIGVGGKKGEVNTPTVFNSGFLSRLFWDGRAATLEEHINFQKNNPCAMDTTWDEVIGKLEQDASYRNDFEEIYPEIIQHSTIKDAIATFERSLTTPNGKFDRYLRGDKHALDDEELAGYELFKSLGCISCHQGMNVGGNMYEKLGVIDDYFEDRGNVQKIDYGRYNDTGIEENRYEFRVPSLRNVALTAPYFHDASASTLAQAVFIMGRYQLGVELDAGEISRIVKFLDTLTGIYQGDAAE